jgi:hypothetical protein
MVMGKQANFLGAYMGAFKKLLIIILAKSTDIGSRHSHQIVKSTRFIRVFLCLRISAILS